MPRPRPPHLHRHVTRHGKVVWYVRLIAGGKNIRIMGEYGSAEFMAAYRAAVSGEAPAPAPGVDPRSVGWLIEEYRKSRAWLSLKPPTRRQRENIFRRLLADNGKTPFAAIKRTHIEAALDRRAGTPFAAKNFLQALRHLYAWAISRGFVAANPTDGVKFERPATEGFAVWSEADIAKFEAHWPVGTRERLALAIFLYTGLRRGDAAILGRQHITDGVISLKTEKTNTAVIIPVLPELQEIIDASPTGDMVFIATKAGKPMVKEGLGNWFREACDAAGIEKGKSAHGLRKAGATRLANNGATVAQLEAIFGWTGGNMASLYTRTADRTRLAADAIKMLSKPKAGTSMLTPSPKVRTLEKKK
jgi:integrase